MLPGLGDLLCAVPAMVGLRRALPRAEVTLIGRRHSQWFAERFPELVDDWLGCDWCPGLVETVPDARALTDMLATARSRCFDLAIQMHGDGTATNAFTAALGASSWGGLAQRPGDHVRSVPASTHEIDRCVEAVRATGLRIDAGSMRVPLRPSDELPSAVPPGPFAVVHAGASRSERRWPAPSFAAVADRLLDHVDHVVLTGGAREGAVVDAVRGGGSLRERRADRFVDLHGSTDLGALAALLASARLVVSNDTGVAHLAAAVQAPTVTIFGRPDRVRWEPPGAICVGGPDGWPDVDQVIVAAESLLTEDATC